MLSLAYFIVFIIGLVTCFRSSTSFFNNRNYIKAGSSISLAIFAIGGLFQAILGA